jgi:Rod binding domain-containing protein
MVAAATSRPVPASPGPLHGREGLRQAAQGFESLFTHMLLQSMRKTVHKSRLFHGGHGEETFQDLLDTRMAEASSKHGKGLGISEMIVKRYAKHVQAMEEQKGKALNIVAGPEGSTQTPGVKRD